jgi:hypothetical protein
VAKSQEVVIHDQQGDTRDQAGDANRNRGGADKTFTEDDVSDT